MGQNDVDDLYDENGMPVRPLWRRVLRGIGWAILVLAALCAALIWWAADSKSFGQVFTVAAIGFAIYMVTQIIGDGLNKHSRRYHRLEEQVRELKSQIAWLERRVTELSRRDRDRFS